MNLKSIALLLSAFCFCSWSKADGPPIGNAKPQNGVFFTYTGYMTTVLELKDGKFRYWFESDVKHLEEPAYPITGSYTIKGDTLLLEHPQVSQPQWTFRKVGEILTLWRPDALGTGEAAPQDLNYFKRYGAGNILVATDEPAPKLWKERGPPVVKD